MSHRIILTVLAALVWAAPAAALEADQVRGEIVEISPDEERLRLRVEESGDESLASAGTVAEYRIPPDTRVEMENPTASLLDPTLDDLAEGENVILNFENVNGEMVARNVASSDSGQGASGSDQDQRAAASGGTSSGSQSSGADLAQRDDPSGQRSQLPGTASLLPALAMAGGIFGLLAVAIRVWRKR